eukprot:CAMPEP_0175163294 /NCGR_PEP_ID=MMETSP0087-20121206/25667_1 /TAXON_ID=136419 /ORGANISM="Unknown Unknown, Strain D1" /LENGTH=101 /DNA_ID=CAMNT_0016451977 /DNA_START=577 /DNA_END=879 /DNA_ORIENTATION=+
MRFSVVAELKTRIQLHTQRIFVLPVELSDVLQNVYFDVCSFEVAFDRPHNFEGKSFFSFQIVDVKHSSKRAFTCKPFHFVSIPDQVTHFDADLAFFICAAL